PLRLDALASLFGWLFHLAAFLAVLFSLHVNDRVHAAAGPLYAGSAVLAVFAGDLVTLFAAWELLAFTSVFLVWARRTERAHGAGIRYLIVNVLSGVLLLAGVVVRQADGGSLLFERMTLG